MWSADRICEKDLYSYKAWLNLEFLSAHVQCPMAELVVSRRQDQKTTIILYKPQGFLTVSSFLSHIQTLSFLT